MATQIGELYVRIGAETTGLDKGFAKAEKSTKKLRDNFTKLVKSAALIGVAAAAAGAAMAVHIVKQTMASIDAQAKLARQLNTTIEGLTTIQHAGEMAGISTGKMNSALERLNKSLGDASQGMKLQADAFEDLGLSLDELFEMNADERIGTIAQAIKDTIPPTEQAAVAAAIFGRSMGRAILELDAEAIAKAAHEVEALGLAVGEVDAAKIERANDAIYTIGRVLEGMANKITVRLAPAIEGIAVAFKDWAVETEGFSKQFESTVNAVLFGAKWIANALWGLNAIWKGLEGAAAGWAAVATGAIATVGEAMLKLVRFMAEKINWLVTQFNKIPGVSLPPIDTSSLDQRIKELDDFKQEAWNSAKEAADGVAAAWASTPWGDKMMAAIKATQGEASDLFKKPPTEGGEAAPEGEDTAAADLAKERETRLQVIRDSLKSEQELEEEFHAERMEFLEEAALSEQETQAERDALKEEEAEAHAARMKAIKEQQVRDEVGISKRGWLQQLRNQSSAMKQMLGDLRGNLTTLFGENKAFNLAMGLIDAYKAITSSYSYGASVGGPPMGAAMAAVAAAAQFKILSDMASVQPGSSGSKGGGGGGGGGPVASAPGPAETGAGGGGGYATINIVGGDAATFTGSQIRDLIEQLNEYSAKGMVVRVA